MILAQLKENVIYVLTGALNILLNHEGNTCRSKSICSNWFELQLFNVAFSREAAASDFIVDS